jgi:hypothetical protein
MAHLAQTVNYSVIRGLPWERLIIVKNRRTHRVVKPTDSRSYVATTGNAKVEITTMITKENGILLSLTGEETQDLPLGTLSYDVLATIDGVQRPVAQGTITVTALDTVTPLEDAQAMEIRFKQHTDYRRTFTWKDEYGDVLTVQNAYMQAKDSEGTTVLDLRWFSTAPTDPDIVLLPPERRGYLAPVSGATLEIHVSDQNPVPAGSYPFDLFVQDSAGDWDCLASGTVVVEAAISSPPA